jgi:uncharacterized protein YbjQ (UPF0145 family)
MPAKTPDEQRLEMEEQLDAQRSMALLAQGGLPLRAQRRLADQAKKGSSLFTSDLSVNEFLAARHVGCEPIGQVMGSSIYHVGWTPEYKGYTGEIDTVSQAHREARRLSISRMAQEAAALGAHGVIGVHLKSKGYEWSEGLIEFSAIGTAIRLPGAIPQAPFLSDLSGQEFWTILNAGFVPVGLAMGISIYHVHHVMYPGGWSFNNELKTATKGVYDARHIAMRRLEQEAQQLGATGVVGMQITTRVREIECAFPECEYDDIEVEFFALGTAVRRTSEKPDRPAPRLALSMLPLKRSSTEDEELKFGENVQHEGKSEATAERAKAENKAEKE